jgi:hypothetical protein
MMTPERATIAAAMEMGAALPSVEQTTSWSSSLKAHGKMMAAYVPGPLASPWALGLTPKA